MKLDLSRHTSTATQLNCSEVFDVLCAELQQVHGKYVPLGLCAGPPPHCARLMHAASFARRGLQQPDVATVAHVKRTYVQVRRRIFVAFCF